MARPVARKKLLRLRDSGRLLTVERRLLNKKADALRGYLVEVGQDWVVVLTLDGVYFDGFNVVRTKHISRARALPTADDDFVTRAEHARGPFPEPPEELVEGVNSAGIEALHLFLSAAPLVGLHIEAKYPDAIDIGQYEGSSHKWVALREIDPQGRWHADASSYRARSISRITVGGRYIDALIEFGDEPPEV